jgi:hypothetical protein
VGQIGSLVSDSLESTLFSRAFPQRQIELGHLLARIEQDNQNFVIQRAGKSVDVILGVEMLEASCT